MLSGTETTELGPFMADSLREAITVLQVKATGTSPFSMYVGNDGGPVNVIVRLLPPGTQTGH